MNSPEPPPGYWPTSTPAQALAARRERLCERLLGPALLAAGWPRPRNFPHNCHPFRAESHFLYLVGRQLPGAVLRLEPGGSRLYAPPPDPDARLWHGPEPTLAELERELGLEVRPLSELEPARGHESGVATVPPQDPAAADWLSQQLGRTVRPSALPSESADVALAEALIALRLCHDQAALAQLRQAAAVTCEAHLAGLRATRPGLREAQVRARMEATIVGSGMTLAYWPIVTVEGQVLHAQRHDRVLAAGDLLLADVGAETPEGWAADVTRTWPVSGRFSPSQRDVYQVVHHAQAAALAAVRPGVRYADVHRASQRALLQGLVDLKLLRGSLEELIACHAVALFYPHGVGHLLGLDVHDMEDLGDRAGYAPGRSRQANPSARYLRLDRDLRPGMVVTIEPGFYQIPELLAGIEAGSALDRALDRERLAQLSDVKGIRIEDDVLVTDGGCEVLTAAVPGEVGALERAVAGQ